MGENAKKAIIIGAAGFVGNYLIDHLALDKGMEVYATKLAHESLENKNARVFNLDILNKQEIVDLLFKIRPDYIFHLAAQSSVALSCNPLIRSVRWE